MNKRQKNYISCFSFQLLILIYLSTFYRFPLNCSPWFFQVDGAYKIKVISLFQTWQFRDVPFRKVQICAITLFSRVRKRPLAANRPIYLYLEIRQKINRTFDSIQCFHFLCSGSLSIKITEKKGEKYYLANAHDVTDYKVSLSAIFFFISGNRATCSLRPFHTRRSLLLRVFLEQLAI